MTSLFQNFSRQNQDQDKLTFSRMRLVGNAKDSLRSAVDHNGYPLASRKDPCCSLEDLDNVELGQLAFQDELIVGTFSEFLQEFRYGALEQVRRV